MRCQPSTARAYCPKGALTSVALPDAIGHPVTNLSYQCHSQNAPHSPANHRRRLPLLAHYRPWVHVMTFPASGPIIAHWHLMALRDGSRTPHTAMTARPAHPRGPMLPPINAKWYHLHSELDTVSPSHSYAIQLQGSLTIKRHLFICLNHNEPSSGTAVQLLSPSTVNTHIMML